MKMKYFELRPSRNVMAVIVTSMSLFYLTGCSSDNDPGNTDIDVPQPELSKASYSVKASDASRIINYTTTDSRADATASFEMPECPTIPADAKNLNETDQWGNKINYNYGTLAAGTYYVATGDKFDGGFNLNSATIYVAGELNVPNLSSSNENTFYVLPGGKLSFGEYVAITPGVTVYNYGTLAANVTVGENARVYSAVDITECSRFGVNSNAEFYSKGSIVADDVRLNGTAIACAFIADKIDIHSTGTIKTSYFKAGNITMNTGYIVLDNNGLIDADELSITNGDTRVTVDGNNAVVAARKFVTNNLSWPKQIFAPEVAMDITDAYLAQQKIAVNDYEFQVSNDDRVAYVPAAGCHGAYPEGTPEPTPEPEITIEKITDIEPLDPDHDHGVISATCITFDGNKAYASYHLRGQGQKGCIEVIEDNGTALKLNSYMISPDYDFNHLIVDNGNIITVGNHAKKGAFIGSLPVDFGASETVREDFSVKELTTDDVITETGKDGNEIKAGYKNAGDGNCVIRQGDHYYVNTYRGYGSLNLDFTKVKGSFQPTGGSSKHIAIANGKAAILSLDTQDNTSSASTVNLYDAADNMFSNIKQSYSAGIISPVDGKNVVAIDGENVYACLGKGGLVRLNDGKEFHAGADGKVPANGMAIDENYVYAAMGSFVFVLDKNDLTEVTHYHAASEKSANYIALHDGKIYVAFGEDGIQVFKLNKK